MYTFTFSDDIVERVFKSVNKKHEKRKAEAARFRL